MPAAQAGTVVDFASMPDDELLAGLPTQTAAPGMPDFSSMSDDELLAGLAPQQPDSPPDRSWWEQVKRPLGLAARSTLNGVGQLTEFVSEPVRQLTNVGLRALDLPQAAPASALTTTLADKIGLPAPETAQERIAGDVVSMMIPGAGTLKAANTIAKTANGVTKEVMKLLGSHPGAQLTSAAAAGAGQGFAREAGAGDVGQTAASFLAGFAAPSALSRMQNAARNVGGRVNAMRPQLVLERVRESLNVAGIDFDQLPARVQQQLQQEAAQALRHGEFDPAALARLASFKRVDDATPTRGMLTQDPGQVTREQNLAKLQANTGVNTSNPGARNLSQIQADNNAALVRAINDMGANSSDDAVAIGQRAIDALQSRLDKQQARVNELYKQAKDSAGRSFPLDGPTFADNAIKALKKNMSWAALPSDVKKRLIKISRGEEPLTVEDAEQFKTLIGRKQRNTQDGDVRWGLGMVRRELDAAQPMPLGTQPPAPGTRTVNPGMLPATQDAELGQQAVEAFNKARASNRAMMRQIERTPALRDLYDGNITPDDFVNKYVIGSAAKAADVQRLSRILAANPQAREAVRTSITQHLKNKALSGVPDDIGAAKFSASQFAKELQRIGDRKLRAFFDSDEVAQLQAISQVARLMTNQPVGSAVNNSNTSAALFSRVLNSMGNVGRGLKVLGIGDQIGAIQNALRQRSARQVPPALAAPPAAQPPGSRLLPATVYGGLLPLSSAPPGQDYRRK